MTPRSTDDPREGGGGMFDAGGPHDRGRVMFDTRKAVLVEQYEVAVAHGTSGGAPLPDSVAILCRGRINRPPDDAMTASSPAEPVEHLHLTSWELAADLIAELHALAARDGSVDLSSLVRVRWEEIRDQGFTRRAP